MKTRIEMWIEEGVELVNRCNTLREHQPFCEACGCPEFTPLPKENAMSTDVTDVMEPDQQAAEADHPKKEAEAVAELKAKLAQYEEAVEFKSEVLKRQARIRELESAMEIAKESAKESKAAWEAANKAFSQFAAKWEADGNRPLFAQGNGSPAKADAWRTAGIMELDLACHTACRLGEAGIDTLGALADRMKKMGLRWWDDIEGIGENKAARIADALADFWAKHPEYKATQSGDGKAESGDEAEVEAEPEEPEEYTEGDEFPEDDVTE